MGIEAFVYPPAARKLASINATLKAAFNNIITSILLLIMLHLA